MTVDFEAILGDRNIFMIGMMGAWKSTVGRRLATHLERPFIDLDRAIERGERKTILELFEMLGEEGFRSLEEEYLDYLSAKPSQVISTGGGTVISKKNRKVIYYRGVSIYLEAAPITLHRRIRNVQKRPLLAKSSDRLKTLTDLYEERRKYYESLADLIITTDDLSPTAVVNIIIEEIVNSADEDHTD
ncbi:MAG: shikimate kinase [Candidatus Neomarinimicrobiota bacterium]|nr:MAG: shikimate kinase [Candidatus Neomarinimicrobiota bacterium]